MLGKYSASLIFCLFLLISFVAISDSSVNTKNVASEGKDVNPAAKINPDTSVKNVAPTVSTPAVESAKGEATKTTTTVTGAKSENNTTPFNENMNEATPAKKSATNAINPNTTNATSPTGATAKMSSKEGTGVIVSVPPKSKVSLDNFNVQTVRLTPKIRIESPSEVYKISINDILPYLKTSLILDSKEQFMNAPYVVSQGHGESFVGTGSNLYVVGLKENEDFTHQLYKEGQVYFHPITKEMLGFEARQVATVELNEPGEPAQFTVSSALEPVEIGMRLFPSYASVLPSQLKIKPANALAGQGFILSARGELGQIGINDIVVISLGQREGIEEGEYLDVYQTNRKVVDSVTSDWRKSQVQLPDYRVGRILVFQTFEKLSLALVLEANEIIHLLDTVKSP